MAEEKVTLSPTPEKAPRKEAAKQAQKKPETAPQKETSKEAPREPEKAPAKETPKDASKAAAKDSQKDSPKDSQKESLKEAPKDTAKDAQKEASKETAKEASKESAKESAKDAAKDAARDGRASKDAKEPKEKETKKSAPSAQSEAAEKDEEEDAPEESSYTLSGTTVCGGVAFGYAQQLGEGELEVPHFSIEKSQTRAEFTRLRAAINTVARELGELLETSANSDAPPEAVAFIEMHCQILKDESLISDTQDIIRERLINAEWALSLKLEDLRRAFEELDDAYLAERVEDIAQVVERVQRVLTGRRRPADTVSQMMRESSVILVAEDLSPADVLILKRRRDISVAGLVIENGSLTSHTAILARSLEIPTLVHVVGARGRIENDDVLLLDADRGLVTVNPQAELLPKISGRIQQLKAIRARQRELKSTPAATADGQSVRLCANIALPEDVRDAAGSGADGIGLFRSEFLFMNRPVLPSEDEQYETYRRVIRAMKDKPVTIRTADLGGDKMPSREALESLGYDCSREIVNPALGQRAIRFSLGFPELFMTQIRAILRAAFDANVRILIPMLSRVSEIMIVSDCIRRAQEELKDRGEEYAEHIALGGMIEVPAVAMSLPIFLRRLDFVSIGTNDLIQYMLAVDREDTSVSQIYDPMHPAVLAVLSKTIATANKAGKEISVCGEVAGDPVYAKLLLGMGLRNFSMDCARVLPLKEKILAYSAADAEELVRRLKRCDTCSGVRSMVLEHFQSCGDPQAQELAEKLALSMPQPVAAPVAASA